MAAPAAEITYASLSAAIKRGEFAPIYLLMGEEEYYIDQLSEQIVDAALSEQEREFNLTVIHCERETKPADIVTAARRYPVMAQRQVVLVREAQFLKSYEPLVAYVEHLSPTTVLVLCHKRGTFERRGNFYQGVSAKGIVFESKRPREGQLATFINQYFSQRNVSVEPQAAMMLAANVGTDLSRLSQEMDKLCVVATNTAGSITPAIVEAHVGISREYNLWELRTAISKKDVVKAQRILNHFMSDGGKETPPIMIIATIFAFFASLMQLYYAPERTEQGLMQYMELKNTWALRDYFSAMRSYSARKTMQIIDKLREADTRLKGQGGSNTTPADIMNELLFFIMH